jgi:calcineurin-like phosphoesterase family protein
MNIKQLPADRLFFTSDSHFGHANIIKYCNRPFDDVNHMNKVLCEQWNNIVPKDGIVFHLGDFTFRAKNAIREYRKNLNGVIYLCEGNHENSKEVRKSGCFEQIADLYDMVVDDEEVSDGFQRIAACHYPMISWNHSGRGAFHCFGHVHGVPVTQNKMAVDVGVDVWKYAPISYQQLKTHITQQYMKT